MKTLKLVLGILSIVLSAMVLFQSCAAGAANALAENGESSGTAGFFVALLLIAGGIIMLATRKSGKKGGSIAALILYAVAALIGFSSAGTFKDLNIWAGVSAALAVVNLVALATGKKTPDETASGKDSEGGNT